MNKNFALLAVLLALSIPLTGCNKKGKLAEHSINKAPTGPVELKLKWPVGERIEQDMDMKMTMEMNIPGQPAPMQQNMTMGQAYGLTVLATTPDGGHEVEMDFLSARMGMKVGDKAVMDYDSEKKTATTANGKPDPAGEMFGKIVGTKIRYFLDASNAVDHIEGTDELIAKLSGGGNAAAAASMKSMFSESYFKQMMSANQFMPPNAVSPGDSWPVRIEMPMAQLGIMVMDYTFTLVRWEMHGPRNCARLEFSGTVATKPDPAAKPGGMAINISDGTTTGISWFDPELGITIDTTMNQDMKMVITTPMPQRAKPGAARPAPKMMNITNQMNQAMTIKLVSVK